jgi:hypothetical protein
LPRARRFGNFRDGTAVALSRDHHPFSAGGLPMALRPVTREHFENVLSLPHERKSPGEAVSWYASEDDLIAGEIAYDPATERWYGVVYAQHPDGWAEVDRSGDGFFDLDDAERALLSAAASMQTLRQSG